MKDENNQGSRTEMKVQPTQDVASLAEQLVSSARITGLPDKAFFKSFTPRRRREIVYNVDAQAGAFSLRLEVHGSGRMKAQVTMACVSIEDGVIHECNDRQALSWAHNGEEADLVTRLDHRHLEDFPCPHDVMAAFIEAIDTQKRAFCPGGFMQWRAMMQLFADRVAREHRSPIEIVALLPLPVEQTGASGRGPTDVEVNDLTDPDSPQRIQGYEDDLKDMDEAMTPEAVTLMLLPPGYIVCRRHREIFTAG
jgi:hypothetical protein